MLHMTELLAHSELVPLKARLALREALAAPEDRKHETLRAAARALYDEGSIDCSDAMELVGLSEHQCGNA